MKLKNAQKPSSRKLELVVVPKANAKAGENGQKETSLTEQNLKALDEYVAATEGRDSPLSRLSPPDLSQHHNEMRTKGSLRSREDDAKATDERILKSLQKESRPAVPPLQKESRAEISTPPPCYDDYEADQENKRRVSSSRSGLKEKNHKRKKKVQDCPTDTDDSDTEDEETDIVGTLLKLYLKR